MAIIANTQAPYRLHLHRRIAREIPEIGLYSLFTHWSHPEAGWDPVSPAEINPVVFASGPSHATGLRVQTEEWRKSADIIRWLRDHAVDVVLVNGYGDLGRLRIIRWCARRGIPLLLWGDSNIRGDRAVGLKGFFKRLVVGWVMRRCAAVLPCGTNGMAFFAKYGATADQMFRFPLEPDYTQIESITADQIRTVQDRFGLDARRRHIVFSGRLVELKRVDLLIDAFVAIAPDRTEWDVVIVGDGPLRETLEQRVPETLRGRFHWTGFLGDQATISAIYRACDVLVLPSNRDAWALVINEAAAAGLAIVCSDVVGAAADLVKDGENGRTFKSESLQDLIATLRDTTAAEQVDAMRAASRRVLADWRERADPIDGLRRALTAAGIRSASQFSR